MSSWLNGLANGLWFLTSLPEAARYYRHRHRVAASQEHYLRQLLRANADTAFGRRYDFASINTVAHYQQRLPLSTYDTYATGIDQIGQGHPQILTHEPVQLLEPTSGSTAATKLIPYTASLKAEFQRAIAPWIVNLFWHYPRLMRGQAYWSVSPVAQRDQRTSGGIPIGFADDADYLGGFQRHLIQALMAVPPQVRLIDDIPTFRYITLLFLLRSRNLTLISVWNPTFLTLLLEPLTDWWPQLADDIEHGMLSPPGEFNPDLAHIFKSLNRANPNRAREIRLAFRQSIGLPTDLLWPQLGLISCWADAHALMHLPALRQLFPNVPIQPKGLLATEGFVSFPFIEKGDLTIQSNSFNLEQEDTKTQRHEEGKKGKGGMLAYHSHFFEFLPEGGDRPLLAHELEAGQVYEVILTTGGGLYRYQLHDLVEVVGHWGQIPRLRFVGKTGLVSDHFGEKLNERHVSKIFETLFGHYQLAPSFAMLACETTRQVAAYTLFIEISHLSNQIVTSLAADLEQALQENFHYQYCRQLGQLRQARVFCVTAHAQQTYLATCQKRGQRLGDIKSVALDRGGDWATKFTGDYVAL